MEWVEGVKVRIMIARGRSICGHEASHNTFAQQHLTMTTIPYEIYSPTSGRATLQPRPPRHARLVSKDGAAGLDAGGVHGQDRDLFPLFHQVTAQRLDQRRLSGAGRAGDAHAQARQRGGGRQHGRGRQLGQQGRGLMGWMVDLS